jgi:hypothetical protein
VLWKWDAKAKPTRLPKARAEVEALSREAERLENECSLVENQFGETRQAPSIVRTPRQHDKEAKEARAAVVTEQTKAAESEREKADLFRQIADFARLSEPLTSFITFRFS